METAPHRTEPSTPIPDATAPRELPPDVHPFIGRDAELDELESARIGDGAPASVIALAGVAGVGKTTTAVHWAHRIADQYPDGNLYVDLRGFSTGPPLPPVEAMGMLLRSLGVSNDRIPPDPDEADALYRAETGGKRLLIVLDNAESADQVLPLIPSGGASLTIVTSRDRLVDLLDLTGAHLMRLGPFAPGEAARLLNRLLELDHTEIAPDIDELAERCGHLPLALRIAAADLAGRTHLDLGAYTARSTTGGSFALADESPSTAVRYAFERSYATLPQEVRTVCGLLESAPVRSLTAEAIAVLADCSAEAAERALDRLVDANLAYQDGRKRFYLHDLVRDYASDMAEPDPGAVERLMDWYLERATEAAGMLYPGGTGLPGRPPPTRPEGTYDTDRAARWLETERGNLLALARHAADNGGGAMAWKLTGVLNGHAWVEFSGSEFLSLGHSGLHGAREVGSLEGEAVAEIALSMAYSRISRFAETLSHAERAVELAERVGWTPGRASGLHNATVSSWYLGRLSEAVGHGERALALNRELGRKRAQSVNLEALAVTNWALGDLRLTMRLHAEGLELAESIGSSRLRTAHLRGLALVAIDLGQLGRATRYADQAGKSAAETGPDSAESVPTIVDTVLPLAHGDYETALGQAERAARYAAEQSDRTLESSAQTAGAAALNRLRRHEEAREWAARALRTAGAELVGARIDALVEQAVARIEIGETAVALAGARRALDLAVDGEHRVREALALNVIAEAGIRSGEGSDAPGTAKRALKLLRTSGHIPGQAWSLWVLGTAAAAAGDDAGAHEHWTEVRRLHEQMGAPVPPRFEMY